MASSKLKCFFQSHTYKTCLLPEPHLSNANTLLDKVRHADSPRRAHSQIYPAEDVMTTSNNEGQQQPFFLSLQHVHYIEISAGAVSPSQSVEELWWNTGEKTHILTGRGASAPSPGTNPWCLWILHPSLPLPGDEDSVGDCGPSWGQYGQSES